MLWRGHWTWSMALGCSLLGRVGLCRCRSRRRSFGVYLGMLVPWAVVSALDLLHFSGGGCMDGHFGMAHIGGLVNTAWWNRKGGRGSQAGSVRKKLDSASKTNGMPSSGLLSLEPAVTRQPSFLDAYFHVVFFESSCLENVQCYSIPRAYRTYPSWVLKLLGSSSIEDITSPSRLTGLPLTRKLHPAASANLFTHIHSQPASQPTSAAHPSGAGPFRPIHHRLCSLPPLPWWWWSFCMKKCSYTQ